MKEKSKETAWKNISIYLPAYLVTALNEVVKKEGANKSELLQRLIRDYCEKHCDNPTTREQLKKHRLKKIIDNEGSFSSIQQKLMAELKKD